MAVFTRNARCQPVVNGVTRFLRGIYDSGFEGVNNQDMAGHVAARNYARYRFELLIHVQSGTVGNSLRLANAIEPLGMFAWTVGNFFGNFTFDPAAFNPATFGFDVYGNATYTTTPEGTGPFRDLWRQKAAAAGTYTADEPAYIAVGWAGDPAPIPPTRGRDDMVVLHQYSKSVMPEMPTFATFLNDNLTQWRDWSPFDIGDWLGCDIYTIGQAPEIHPDNGTGIPSTYGYMNFSVAEAVSLARYYCPLYNRVPHVVLGALKFGGSSRFITLSELWSHMVVAAAELRGVGAIIWWALGVQDGALDQRPFQVSSGNGVQTVFPCPNHLVEETVDVEVKIANVVQPPSAYTVQNVGDGTLVRSGNFWVLQNPPTVTLATPPPSGTNNVVVTTWRWPQTKRNATKDLLETMSTLLADLEPIMIQPSDPALLTSNSLEAADFLSWRIPYCNTLRSQAADRPVWLFGAIARYQEEYDFLNQVPPNYTNSLHIMDQKADVRTCCWESGDVGIVASFNQHPDPRTGTLQWHRTVTRVEVLGENRDVPVNGDGRSWTDTWGGASSLRQGSFNQGHLYRLHLDTDNSYDAWINPALETPTEVFDDQVTVGIGGSFAMHAGGKDASGSVDPTGVEHDNFRVAFKKIALQGEALYDPWVNPSLETPVEVVDDQITVGIGGSFAIHAGGREPEGSVEATSVEHESFRVAFKKIALQGESLYDPWVNPSIATPGVVFDDEIQVGIGGSFAMHAGTKDVAGGVDPTSVTHDSFRVAFKKIALQGEPEITAPRAQARMDWVLR